MFGIGPQREGEKVTYHANSNGLRFTISLEVKAIIVSTRSRRE